MRSTFRFLLTISLGLAVCIAAPVAGFVMRARGRIAWGALIVFVPPLIGLGFMTV